MLFNHKVKIGVSANGSWKHGLAQKGSYDVNNFQGFLNADYFFVPDGVVNSFLHAGIGFSRLQTRIAALSTTDTIHFSSSELIPNGEYRTFDLSGPAFDVAPGCSIPFVLQRSHPEPNWKSNMILICPSIGMNKQVSGDWKGSNGTSSTDVVAFDPFFLYLRLCISRGCVTEREVTNKGD